MSGECSDDTEQKYAFWIESGDYEQCIPYDDGDISFEFTERQAKRLIGRLKRQCVDTDTHQNE